MEREMNSANQKNDIKTGDDGLSTSSSSHSKKKWQT